MKQCVCVDAEWSQCGASSGSHGELHPARSCRVGTEGPCEKPKLSRLVLIFCSAWCSDGRRFTSDSFYVCSGKWRESLLQCRVTLVFIVFSSGRLFDVATLGWLRLAMWTKSGKLPSKTRALFHRIAWLRRGRRFFATVTSGANWRNNTFEHWCRRTFHCHGSATCQATVASDCCHGAIKMAEAACRIPRWLPLLLRG